MKFNSGMRSAFTWNVENNKTEMKNIAMIK